MSLMCPKCGECLMYCACEGNPLNRKVDEDGELDRLHALEVKVREILSQIGDDPCHLDWGVLYPELATLAGMPDWKPNILPPMAMARNCLHFIECFSKGKPEEYHPPVITEEEARRLRAKLDEAEYDRASVSRLFEEQFAENLELKKRIDDLKVVVRYAIGAIKDPDYYAKESTLKVLEAVLP